MLDWLGSVQIRKRTGTRVELELTRATAWTGWILAAGGAWLAALGAAWSIVLGVFVIAIGVLLGTLRRSLIFDRDEGLLRSEQRVLGVRRRAAIPLFHLRAVVVAYRRGDHTVAINTTPEPRRVPLRGEARLATEHAALRSDTLAPHAGAVAQD